MGKIKLVYANCDFDTGESVAIIQTELGQFKGYAFLHEEDWDIRSQFSGCTYAQNRAVIAYFKEKIKIQKTKVKTLKDMITTLEQLIDYDKDCHEARMVRKQYYIEQNKLEKMQEDCKNLQEMNFMMMQERRKVIDSIQEKVETIREKNKAIKERNEMLAAEQEKAED